MTNSTVKCKAHTAKEDKADSGDAYQSNVSTLDYFRTSANIETNNEASRLLCKELIMNLVMFSQESEVLKAPSS